MSEEKSGAPAPETSTPAVDELKNLKMEMNRKLENQNSQLQQLLSALKTPAPQPATAKPVSVFEDEMEYGARIKREAKDEIRAELHAQNAAQSKYQTIVNQIVNDYPEANDTGSALYARAQEVYKELSDDEKSSPLAMKTAVMSAAAEIGLKPKSKRSNNDDNFSMGSSGTNSTRRQREPDMDPATLEFARLLGRPVDDPKYVAKLKETAKQAAWNKKR